MTSPVPIPDEAVEAAAEALYSIHYGAWLSEPEGLRDDYRREARAALAAAVPFILEAAAQRIEAQERLPYAMQRYVRMADAAVVRGVSR